MLARPSSGSGRRYFYLRDHIVTYAETVRPTSLCAYCARMKRGALYSCAAKEGYNVLALAQHLDDLAESFLMSALHNGHIRTMRAHYLADRGIRVIRPLVYARERLTRDFARAARLPVVNENCPACFEEPKERARVKKLLAREESIFPNIYGALRRALRPLMDDGVYAAIDASDATVDARRVRSRPKPAPPPSTWDHLVCGFNDAVESGVRAANDALGGAAGLLGSRAGPEGN